MKTITHAGAESMINFCSNRVSGARFLATAVLAVLGTTSTSSARTVSVPSPGITTISEAIVRSKTGDTIMVSDGVYKEHLLLTYGVALVARSRFRAIIDGGGRGTVVTLGKNNLVSGFEIRNGTFGIFSNGSGNVIQSCRIVRNWQTGIITVRHLPKIEDNIIAFNRSSGIQGWDVRSTSSSVNHNTIAYNGNHGIAMGGRSNILVENNVLAFNERFGIKVLPEAENIRIASNNFYSNINQPGGLPDGNYSFDPAFMAPRRALNFASDPKQCCKIKGTDNENLGTRLIY